MNYPILYLSQQTGVDANAKLVAALHQISLSAGGEIVVDMEILNSPGIVLTAAHSNLKIRGSSRASTFAAAIGTSTLIKIQGASGIEIENLKLIGGGTSICSVVKVDDLAPRSSDISLRKLVITSNYTAINGSSKGIDISNADEVTIKDCNISHCCYGLWLDGLGSNYLMEGGKIELCSRRAISLRGGKGPLVNVKILGTFLGDQLPYDPKDPLRSPSNTDWFGCQPFRADGSGIYSLVSGVQLIGVSIIDNNAQRGTKDSISFNGTDRFVVANCFIDRTSDAGVAIVTGSTNGIVIGNLIMNTDAAAIAVGSNSDEIGENHHHLIVGNHCIGTAQHRDDEQVDTAAPYRIVNASHCAVLSNASSNDSSYPANYELFARDVDNLHYLGNVSDRQFATRRMRIDNYSYAGNTAQYVTKFASVDGACEGEPVMETTPIAALGGSVIYDETMSSAKIWNGSVWTTI